jgi:hypothetical protein
LSEPRKLCECGCGEPTKICTHTDPEKGWVRGQPLRFAGPGHNARVTNAPHRQVTADDWREEDRGFDTPCWIWQDRREDWDGHRLVMVNKRRIPVHRAVYELLTGPILEGRHLHHRCEQPACVNPEHLELLTPAEHARLHNARLTVAQATRIKYGTEDTHALSEEFGITRRHANAIRRGRSWAHL